MFGRAHEGLKEPYQIPNAVLAFKESEYPFPRGEGYPALRNKFGLALYLCSLTAAAFYAKITVIKLMKGAAK